jgi:hypothetical protein
MPRPRPGARTGNARLPVLPAALPTERISLSIDGDFMAPIHAERTKTRASMTQTFREAMLTWLWFRQHTAPDSDSELVIRKRSTGEVTSVIVVIR